MFWRILLIVNLIVVVSALIAFLPKRADALSNANNGLIFWAIMIVLLLVDIILVVVRYL